MYNKSTYFNKITTDLTVLARAVETKNKLSLTDDAKWGEDFFKDLLNKVYGYNLVNLNEDEQNSVGIDLGDEAKRVCVQVTASNGSEKIKDTLASCDKCKRHESYDELYILIIGYKKKYTAAFTSKFARFTKEECIWDIRNLLAKIRSLSPEQMKEVMDLIDSQLTGVITIDPVELSEEDILAIIDVLADYTQKSLDSNLKDSEQKYKLVKRDEDFISRKNELNNVDDILFNGEIRRSLQYDKQIEAFLGNPINADYQKKYFVFTEAIQKKYAENSDQFSNIGALFGFIFDEVINYENRKEVDDQKLLIVLHNMYFNCDIGNNPA
ncbi:MAG TPA: ABC-three component system protein [Candidatus Paceibacterota bacterium]|jgi:hypothetical protein|nr:ABC-three component system protein [Candidatus Paceibacterota bacterium]